MKNDERIDALHIPGLRIIQNKNYFCYGIDAVLLAHYASVTLSSSVIPSAVEESPSTIESFNAEIVESSPTMTQKEHPLVSSSDSTNVSSSVSTNVSSSGSTRGSPSPTTILDLCTGNAIVPILMSAALSSPSTIESFNAEIVGSSPTMTQKEHPIVSSPASTTVSSSVSTSVSSSGSTRGSPSTINITALELQPQIADLARRSVELNRLQSQIKVVEGNLKDTETLFSPQSFDMVTVNPPYMVPSRGRQSPNRIKMVARQELECTLEDVIKSASFALKEKGSLVMIHRPDRLKEIYSLCKKYHLYIEEQINILPQESHPSTMVIIIAKKSPQPVIASAHPVIASAAKQSPLIIYDNTHHYTKELKQIYNPQSSILNPQSSIPK